MIACCIREETHRILNFIWSVSTITGTIANLAGQSERRIKNETQWRGLENSSLSHIFLSLVMLMEEGPSMNICLHSRAIYLNQNIGTPVQEIYT
jgi:hypothetical protein